MTNSNKYRSAKGKRNQKVNQSKDVYPSIKTI